MNLNFTLEETTMLNHISHYLPQIQSEYPIHWVTDNADVNTVMEECNIGIVYIHSRKTTVAYVKQARSKVALISTAVCSKHDQFVKRTGKMIAVNRLLDGEFINIPVADGYSIEAQIFHMFDLGATW